MIEINQEQLENQQDVDGQAANESFGVFSQVSFASTENSPPLLSSFTNCSFESDSTRATSPSVFKKLPALNRAFVKKSIKVATCKFCNKDINSSEISRMLPHLKKCKLIDPELRMELQSSYDRLTGKKRDKNFMINEAWSRYQVNGNVTISSVELKSFKVFAHLVNPEWKYPDRHKITQEFIPSMSQKIVRNFLTVNKRNLSFICVEFDHWTDITSKSLLGVVFTVPSGDRYMQGLVNVSREGKTAQVTMKHLLSTMSSVPKSTINSIVSDSDRACELARKLIVERPDYKHVINHRCIAHLLNRMGNMFVEDHHLKSTFEFASKIVNFASHSSKLLAILEECAQRRPKKACETRWYSSVNMVESLLDAKRLILETCIGNLEITRSNCEWMKQESHWQDLERAQKVLRPLANCIGVAERKNGTVGEAVRTLLYQLRDLFMRDWGDVLTVNAIAAILNYFGPDKLGEEEFALLLAAYVLDRRNKCDYITEEGLDLVHDAVIRIAKKNDCSTLSINNVLSEEYSQYCAQGGRFAKHQQLEESAESWWSEISVCSALRQVALRIARLRSSSANIERTFSGLKFIQGSRRTNMSVETLTHISRIRIYDQFDGSVLDQQEDYNDLAESQLDLSNSDIAQEDTIVFEQSQSNNQQARPDQYVPDLFDTETRRVYEKFAKYVDFTIVNELTTELERDQELSPEKEAELRAKSRDLRQSIRNARSKTVDVD